MPYAAPSGPLPKEASAAHACAGHVTCECRRSLDLGQFERFKRVFFTPWYQPLVGHESSAVLSQLPVTRDCLMSRVLVRHGLSGDKSATYEVTLRRVRRLATVCVAGTRHACLHAGCLFICPHGDVAGNRPQGLEQGTIMQSRLYRCVGIHVCCQVCNQSRRQTLKHVGLSV